MAIHRHVARLLVKIFKILNRYRLVVVQLSTDSAAVPDGTRGVTCCKYDTPMKPVQCRYKDIELTMLDITRRSGQKIAAIINPKYIQAVLRLHGSLTTRFSK